MPDLEYMLPQKRNPVACIGGYGDLVTDEPRPKNDEACTADQEGAEPPLLTTEEAIAEVKRWIEEHRIDPNQIFARTGALVVRYGDLVAHLEQETDEGRLLIQAISRGRVIRQQRKSPGALGGDQK